MRVWRQIERAAVSEERNCVGAGGEDVLRTGATISGAGGDRAAFGATFGATGARRFVGPGGRYREAIYQHATAGQHRDTARECHGGAGSDEPVCSESQVADLFAADDGPDGNH